MTHTCGVANISHLTYTDFAVNCCKFSATEVAEPKLQCSGMCFMLSFSSVSVC